MLIVVYTYSTLCSSLSCISPSLTLHLSPSFYRSSHTHAEQSPPPPPPLLTSVFLPLSLSLHLSWHKCACVSGWERHQNEFACKLRISVFGEDSSLSARLLQRLTLRHKQAHWHQTSWQERVGLLFGSETGGGGDCSCGTILNDLHSS